MSNSHERIISCVSYLRRSEDRFGSMSNETLYSIAFSFTSGLLELNPVERASLEYRTAALETEVKLLDVGASRLRIVAHNKAVEDIVYVLEAAGVVESAKPGGLQKIRDLNNEELEIFGGASAASMSETYLKRAGEELVKISKGAKSFSTRQDAKYLLEITTDIKSELDRLGLVDVRKAELEGVLERGPRSLSVIRSSIEAYSAIYGLIGFGSLSYLIHHYADTRRHLRIAGSELG